MKILRPKKSRNPSFKKRSFVWLQSLERTPNYKNTLQYDLLFSNDEFRFTSLKTRSFAGDKMFGDIERLRESEVKPLTSPTLGELTPAALVDFEIRQNLESKKIFEIYFLELNELQLNKVVRPSNGGWRIA